MKYSDLSISLDVLYHIIDYNDYVDYLDNLFNNTNYVIIYSMDKEIKGSDHVLARKFTDYIKINFINFLLLETTIGQDENVKFYLYKKIK